MSEPASLQPGHTLPIIVREATPDDASPLLAYVNAMLAEPNIDMPLAPEEFTYTEAQERAFLAHMVESDNSLFLLALATGEIVGQVELRGSQRRATRHVAILAISVRQDWRQRGVGTALMRHALDWARHSGTLARIELFVFARNIAAIRLYEKFGFQVEGRRRRAILCGGTYIDDLIMALLLE